jgi:hypothetical protein
VGAYEADKESTMPQNVRKTIPFNAHIKMAQRMRNAGVTKEIATRKVNALFGRHGHFPDNRNQQIGLDALKVLAFWA